MLTRAGHQVTVVETGEDALKAIAKRKYELIIVDKNLPGIGGLDVLKLARFENPQLLAIMITGFPTPESEVQARQLGVHSYVTKPFGILEIVGLCDQAIRAARASVGNWPRTD